MENTIENKENFRVCAKCNFEGIYTFFVRSGTKYRNLCKPCHAKNTKEKRQQNIEKYREYKKQYRLKNIEKFKKESNKRGKEWYRKNINHVRDYHKKIKHSPQRRFSRYKASAKTRRLEFLVSFEEFCDITSKKCNYCNQYTKNCDFSGIDRKNSEIGYIKSNCISCCEWCNIMKSDFTTDEFIEHIKNILGFYNDNRT